MPLLNFRGTYNVKAKCSNCWTLQDLKVPKGTTVEEYVKSSGKCEVCGCKCLKDYRMFSRMRNAKEKIKESFKWEDEEEEQ
jgi:hypothetical protein